MTLDEKLAIACRAAVLRQAGDRAGYSRLIRTAPMPPYLAKIYKEKVVVEEFKKWMESVGSGGRIWRGLA
jgi:hypothetical protein